MDDVLMKRQPKWWVVLLAGLAAIALGVLFFTQPRTTVFALVMLLGVYWVVRGFLGLIDAAAGQRGYRGARLFAAIISILAGGFVLAEPLISAALVPLAYVIILAVTAIISGAAYIYHGATGGGGGSVILGIFDVILGLLLLAYPYVAAVTLLFTLAVLLIVGGALLVVSSFSLRGPQHVRTPHGAAPA